MKTPSLLLPCALVAATAMADSPPAETSPLQPPLAKKVPRVLEIHGRQLTDDYFWLRDKKDPEVIAYLKAENAYTAEVMKPTLGFQERLYQEMLGRIKETDMEVPYPLRGHLYYKRTEQGRQYPVYARRAGSMEAPEEVLLDLNDLAKGHSFMAIDAFEVSDNNRLLAYSTDSTGFREFTLWIKDLASGSIRQVAERVSGAAWAADNATLFYVVDHPQTKNPYRLYRHEHGSAAPGTLICEEPDERFNLWLRRTRSGEFLLLTSSSHTTSEVRFLHAAKPRDEWDLIAPRQNEHEFYADHHDDRFFILTNDHGARNFRLVTAPIANPGRDQWREIIPHRPGVMLDRADMFQDFYVITERREAIPRLRIFDFKSHQAVEIEVAELVCSINMDINREYATNRVRYRYESFITPSSVFDYDVAAKRSELLKQEPVLSGYDPAQYRSERINATAPDGTAIPVSLVYRKGLKRDGQSPLLLNGYGAYGSAEDVTFRSGRLSLLDRGVVYALAHIRGGGDLGKEWHDAGRMLHKKNTFADFIAAAEHLISEGYTSKDRLVISGGSAGGLLMGAVANMRPDLFKAVVAYVPFVDIINTELDATLPLTAGEWEEWGNPGRNKEHFEYMLSYSPYDNVAALAYPAMLVKTSLNDSQVLFHEPAKWVARLRATQVGSNPLLLQVNMGAGHGGASGRYDALRERAFDYAFILTQLGISQ